MFDLDGSLYILNMWGKQDSYRQEIFKMAFNILEKEKSSSFSDLYKNRKFRQLCKKHGVVHLGGPMLGDITADGVKIWVQTLKPSKVEIRVGTDKGEQSFGPVFSKIEEDLAVIIQVSGLKAGTHYPYTLYIDGTKVDLSFSASFTTLPASASVQNARIAFGTCFHRWGLGNPGQAQQILARKPMAMLLGGDIAVQDRENHIGLHRADYLLRDFTPAWKELAASVPMYATWDDHDYFNNDKWGIPPGYTLEDKEAVWRIFKKSWNNPSYGLEENGEGLFFRTRIGPADVIMLDNRYFRTGEKGSFLGDEQMKWLETQLLDCKGPFIILSCGTMWSDYISRGKDSWGVNDPDGREQIFDLIEKNKIGGVLLISGDRHSARGFRIPRPSGFNFYEFTPASLGGRSQGGNWPATHPDWETQLFGFSGVYAFGEFSFNTKPADPEVTFSLIRDDGEILYQLTLKRSELTP
ncbi:MAG: alkaline phosphatase D family protein [Cyclobacteriaceae bacterium]|nr:alkaline phosphatase D family protein [Cyclobacteriaceae bacterium]